ncbi:MAG: ABC transporter permease, partial [Spirochaetaceae bacterium]|nr:ABC transporter permease [Spirochaetaceae bacterium]
MNSAKHWSKRSEPYVALAIVILSIVIQIQSGQFFTGNNLVDLTRSMIVPGLFAIGALMVIISGGFDVSFPAIASLAMFLTNRILLNMNYSGNVIVAYLMGAGFGLIMGAINGVLIGVLKQPTMVVTLGTSSLFTGIMQGVFAASESPVCPSMAAHGKASLFIATNSKSGLSSEMPVQILILLGALLLAFFIVRYTMLGRSIYAIGGDESAAERTGFNVLGTKIFIYCIVGALAGVTGIVRSSMMINAHPTNLLGMDMTVIAAVVLGG